MSPTTRATLSTVCSGGRRRRSVVDVAQPAAPVALAHLPLPGDPRALVLTGDVGYVAGEEGFLQVVDLADPLAPRRLQLLGQGLIQPSLTSLTSKLVEPDEVGGVMGTVKKISVRARNFLDQTIHSQHRQDRGVSAVMVERASR